MRQPHAVIALPNNIEIDARAQRNGLALVAAGYKVCTFDNRGIAPSYESPQGMHIDDLVADTAGLIELLGEWRTRRVVEDAAPRIVRLFKTLVRAECRKNIRHITFILSIHNIIFPRRYLVLLISVLCLTVK